MNTHITTSGRYKRRFIAGLLGLGLGLLPAWSQDASSLAARALSPTTVSEYFIACPFLTYTEGAGGQKQYWIQLDDEPQHMRLNYLAKQLLLQGVSLDLRHPVRERVVDQKNGYLHLAFEFESLTLVYFERADKSRVVAFRLEDRGTRDIETEWRFYNVKGERWEKLSADQILPPGWLKAYFPQEPTALDSDHLALTRWDLDLPRYGTTVHLIPLSFSADKFGPNETVKIPDTTRKTNLSAYFDWFSRVFADSAKRVKPLELKWNKAAGRFDAGKAALWSAPAPSGAPARSVAEVLTRPSNVWEYFLANTELQVEGDDGLYWMRPGLEHRDPDIDPHSRLLWKQDLLSSGGWGSTYSSEGDPLVIDIPGNYLHAYVEKMERPSEPDPEVFQPGVLVTSRTFTLVAFPAGKTPVVGFRFWAKNGVDDVEAPEGEPDRIAARFYEFAPSGETQTLADESLFPLDQIGTLPLDTSPQDQVLQAAVIWDVQLPRSGTTLRLTPWRLTDRTAEERQPLLATFGSETALAQAFTAFTQWYGDKAVALDWNPLTKQFQAPRLVPRKP